MHTIPFGMDGTRTEKHEEDAVGDRHTGKAMPDDGDHHVQSNLNTDAEQVAFTPRHLVNSILPPALTRLSLVKRMCIFIIFVFIIASVVKTLYYVVPILFEEFSTIEKHIDYEHEVRRRELIVD